MPKTITLKGHFVRKEAKAAGAILPGHLIEFVGAAVTFGNLTVRVHSTIGGKARKAFALENDLLGAGIDDAYAANQTCQYGVFTPGAEVYGKLHAGATCSGGDYLESAGDGTLVPVSGSMPSEGTIGVAMEKQTVAGGRIRIEVL